MRTLKNIILTISVATICAACTEESAIQPPKQEKAITASSATNGVRVVPLKIYMPIDGIQTRVTGYDNELTIANSYGENKNGYDQSVARKLHFYVYERNSGEAGDFFYNSTKSAELNDGQVQLEERIYHDYTYAMATVRFTKQEGKEYKILVTASGKAIEQGYRGNVSNNTWSDIVASSNGTQEQNANEMIYYTKGNANKGIADGDKLSDLMAGVSEVTVEKVPNLKTGSETASYPTVNSSKAYGIQESFYGFCEKTVPSNGDDDPYIITYNDYPSLKAYLRRNVARVEFNATNIYYSETGFYANNFEFKWMGIYARAVGTECKATGYDQFKGSSDSIYVGKDGDNGWRLLTYFSGNTGDALSTPLFTEVDGRGNYFGSGDDTKEKFDSETPGIFNFVTFMLPIQTEFMVRIVWRRTRGLNDSRKFIYCTEYKIPVVIRDVQVQPDEDYAGGNVGVIGGGHAGLFGDGYVNIKRNRRYFFSFDCHDLLKIP